MFTTIDTYTYPRKLAGLTLVGALLTLSCLQTPANASDIDPQTIAMLRMTAEVQGSVYVRVTLVRPGLTDLSLRSADIQRITQANADALLESLGAEAFPEARHISPLGSMEILVTPRGLELLQQSPLPLTVSFGDDWHRNILLPDLDGSLAAVDAELKNQGFAMVVVTLDVEGAEHHISQSTGQAKLVLASTTLQKSAQVKAERVLEKLGLSTVTGRANNRTDNLLALIDQQEVPTLGRITLKADRRALYELARNPDVLAIKPIGYQDRNIFTVDQMALDTASRNGSADVLVQLRMPLLSGQSSKATREAQTRAQQRMLNDILAGLTLKNPAQSFAMLGAASVTLSETDLQKLAFIKDARLRGIVLNRPLFQPSLKTSTSIMNLPFHWNIGRRGAGQTIIVLDTGIEKDHAMLKKSDGTSKVVGEACFQTNAGAFTSFCPSQDINGDSLIQGAGNPHDVSHCLDGYLGQKFKERICSHGTHVAGIAAGRYSPQMGTQLQGVAPDANLMSFNVLTTTQFGGDSRVFMNDVVAAVNLISNMVQTQTTGNYQPFILNMSLGGEPVKDPTNQLPVEPLGAFDTTFAAAVINLKGRGIPTIAAMGNYYHKYQMNRPAAIPGVIKVGAVDNTTGQTMSDYSQRVQPERWPGEYIFLAPGGASFSGVQSSIAYSPSKNAIFSMEGTSMATPHVSGMYAILKSAVPTATVNDISNFLSDQVGQNNSQSINKMYYTVSAQACYPDENSCGIRNFKALRFCFDANNATCN